VPDRTERPSSGSFPGHKEGCWSQELWGCKYVTVCVYTDNSSKQPSACHVWGYDVKVTFADLWNTKPCCVIGGYTDKQTRLNVTRSLWRIRKYQLVEGGDYCQGRKKLVNVCVLHLFKMWVIQEPNKVALWNKQYFEERKAEIMQHV
jgi:hypothetical protein